MQRCDVCDKKHSNSRFCSRICACKYIQKNKLGRYKTGKHVKKYGVCSHCKKTTWSTNGSAIHMFCNVKCKASWQKIHLKGKNNPAFGIKRRDLIVYNKNRVFSEKTLEKIRLNTINQYKSGVFSRSDTLPERTVENYLLFNNITYVKQFPYKLGIADFWLPELNMIIECDGDYWHNKPEVKMRDKKQTEWMKNEGYEVLRLKECDIITDVRGCLKWIA